MEKREHLVVWLTSLQSQFLLHRYKRCAVGVKQQFTVIQQSYRNRSQFFTISFLLPVTTDQNLLKITAPSNPSAYPLSWHFCTSISFTPVKSTPFKPPPAAERAHAPSMFLLYAKHHQHNDLGKTQGNCHAFHTCFPVKNGGAIRDPNTKGGVSPGRLHTSMAGRNPSWHDTQSWHFGDCCWRRSPTPPEEMGPQAKPCSWQRLPHTSNSNHSST